jgi:hypothetical protein
MTEVNQALGCKQGDSYDFSITMQPGEDLTGAEIEWTLTEGLFYGARAVLTKAPASVFLNSDPGINRWQIIMQLTSAETAAIAPATYYHEAKVKLNTGKIRTIEGGPFVLAQSADALGALLT